MRHLTPARRAFLTAAVEHPILWSGEPPHDYHCGSSTICYDSARRLIRAGYIVPDLQGEYCAEVWDNERFLGYRYHITAAGICVATGGNDLDAT